jgi:ankyrin repeat protein
MENQQEAFDALYAGRDGDVIALASDHRDFATVIGGRALLGLACEQKRWDLVRPLLALGADPNGAPGETRPPLHWAIEGGSLPTVTALLDKGASLEKTDKEGRTALWIATAKADARMIALLLAGGGKQDARPAPALN